MISMTNLKPKLVQLLVRIYAMLKNYAQNYFPQTVMITLKRNVLVQNIARKL